MTVKIYTWPVYEISDKNKPKQRNVSAFQKPLSVQQEIDLAVAFRKLGLGSWEDLAGISLADVIEFLNKEKIVNDFLDAILVRAKGCKKEDLMEMPYAVQKEVVKDFLSFNPELQNDLKRLLQSKILRQLIATLQPPSLQKKSSSSPPAEA